MLTYAINLVRAVPSVCSSRLLRLSIHSSREPERLDDQAYRRARAPFFALHTAKTGAPARRPGVASPPPLVIALPAQYNGLSRGDGSEGAHAERAQPLAPSSRGALAAAMNSGRRPAPAFGLEGPVDEWCRTPPSRKRCAGSLCSEHSDTSDHSSRTRQY